MEEKHQKNFLNTAEVADMLGISPATLLEEIQRRAMRAGSVFMGEDGTDE